MSAAATTPAAATAASGERVAARARSGARRGSRRAPRGCVAALGRSPEMTRTSIAPLLADHLVDRRAPPELAPARAQRLAEDDLAHVALARVAHQVLGDVGARGS